MILTVISQSKTIDTMENKVNIEALRERIEAMKKSNLPFVRRMAALLEKRVQKIENKQNN